LENAFEYFGGVRQTLVIDNLKAAVKHPDWFDPERVPKVPAFAAHYGTVTRRRPENRPRSWTRRWGGAIIGLFGRTFTNNHSLPRRDNAFSILGYTADHDSGDRCGVQSIPKYAGLADIRRPGTRVRDKR